MQYEKSESGFFWDHLNPQRLGVPKYQTLFRQVTWLFFLFGESHFRCRYRTELMTSLFADGAKVCLSRTAQTVSAYL